MNLTYSGKIILLTVALMLPILIIFISIVVFQIRKKQATSKFDRVVIDALNYDSAVINKKSFDIKITEFWAKLLKPAGIVKPNSNDKDNVVKIILITVALYLITFLITFNFLIALLPPLALSVGLIVYCKVKINAIEAMINEQVPSFLSALKSNVQSAETPERALVSAIENTAEPLYSELKIVKSYIETGSFDSALSAFRNKTNNEYLKFLCSCIELSTVVGANLEEQIVIIEKMISDRQDLNRKIDSAVAEQMPILYVTAIAVPFLFVYMYLVNDQTRAYWFNSLMSWILFFAIFVICGLGCYFGYKIINSIRKM